MLKEIAEQVAIRLRKAKRKTKCVSISIGFSYDEERKPIIASMKIDPTQQTNQLQEYVIQLFRKKYSGGKVRNIGVRYDQLVSENITVLSLFDDYALVEKEEKLEKVIDDIRAKFGFLSVDELSNQMQHLW